MSLNEYKTKKKEIDILPSILIEEKKLQKKRRIEKNHTVTKLTFIPSDVQIKNNITRKIVESAKIRNNDNNETRNIVESADNGNKENDKRVDTKLFSKPPTSKNRKKKNNERNTKNENTLHNSDILTAVQLSKRQTDEEQHHSISDMAAMFNPSIIIPVEKQSHLFDEIVSLEDGRRNVGGRSLYKHRNSLNLYKDGFTPGHSLIHRYNKKNESRKVTEFHLSLNESTASFVTGNLGVLEISSGLVVKPLKHNPKFHISLDDSADITESRNNIKQMIFNDNDEWDASLTSPFLTSSHQKSSFYHEVNNIDNAIKLITENNSQQEENINPPEETVEVDLSETTTNDLTNESLNENESELKILIENEVEIFNINDNNGEGNWDELHTIPPLKASPNQKPAFYSENNNDTNNSTDFIQEENTMDFSQSKPSSHRSSTRLSFLFNQHTGFICKNCFSSTCRHIENISRLAKYKECYEITPKKEKSRKKKLKIEEYENVEKDSLDDCEENQTKNDQERKSNKEKTKEDTEEKQFNESWENISFSSVSCSSSDSFETSDKESLSSEELPEAKSIRNEIENSIENLVEQLKLKIQNAIDMSDLMKLIKIREARLSDKTGNCIPYDLSVSEIDDTTSFEIDVTFYNDIEDELFGITNKDGEARREGNVNDFEKDNHNEELELNCSELRHTPVVNNSKNTYLAPDRPYDSRESLYYDSDYDDTSYLNACMLSKSSFEKLDINNNVFLSNNENTENRKYTPEKPCTPPNEASSPTKDLYLKVGGKTRSSLQPTSDLETVFETEEVKHSLLHQTMCDYSPVQSLVIDHYDENKLPKDNLPKQSLITDNSTVDTKTHVNTPVAFATTDQPNVNNPTSNHSPNNLSKQSVTYNDTIDGLEDILQTADNIITKISSGHSNVNKKVEEEQKLEEIDKSMSKPVNNSSKNLSVQVTALTHSDLDKNLKHLHKRRSHNKVKHTTSGQPIKKNEKSLKTKVNQTIKSKKTTQERVKTKKLPEIKKRYKKSIKTTESSSTTTEKNQSKILENHENTFQIINEFKNGSLINKVQNGYSKICNQMVEEKLKNDLLQKHLQEKRKESLNSNLFSKLVINSEDEEICSINNPSEKPKYTALLGEKNQKVKKTISAKLVNKIGLKTNLNFTDKSTNTSLEFTKSPENDVEVTESCGLIESHDSSIHRNTSYKHIDFLNLDFKYNNPISGHIDLLSYDDSISEHSRSRSDSGVESHLTDQSSRKIDETQSDVNLASNNYTYKYDILREQRNLSLQRLFSQPHQFSYYDHPDNIMEPMSNYHTHMVNYNRKLKSSQLVNRGSETYIHKTKCIVKPKTPTNFHAPRPPASCRETRKTFQRNLTSPTESFVESLSKISPRVDSELILPQSPINSKIHDYTRYKNNYSCYPTSSTRLFNYSRFSYDYTRLPKSRISTKYDKEDISQSVRHDESLPYDYKRKYDYRNRREMSYKKDNKIDVGPYLTGPYKSRKL